MEDDGHLQTHHSPLTVPMKVTSNRDVASRDIERRDHIITTADNRLKLNLENIEHQQVSNLCQLRREEQNLKNELKYLQSSTGHYHYVPPENRAENAFAKTQSQTQIDSSPKAKGKKAKSVKSLKQLGETFTYETGSSASGSKIESEQEKVDSTERKVVSQLPPVVYGRSGLQLKVITESDKNEDGSIHRLKFDKSLSDTNVSIGTQIKSVTEKSKSEKSKSEQFLNSYNVDWYTNIDAVRSNISKRLSTSTGDVRDLNSSPSGSESMTDCTPYLYAPPDGLPRTMYTMPSMDERMKQARLARYVRKPGTKLDPIDNELDTKDVFDKINMKS